MFSHFARIPFSVSQHFVQYYFNHLMALQMTGTNVRLAPRDAVSFELGESNRPLPQLRVHSQGLLGWELDFEWLEANVVGSKVSSDGLNTPTLTR